MKEKFKVQFLKEAADFLDSIDIKAREKNIYNIQKAQIVNDDTLFKKISGETWEFRTLYKKMHFRLFAQYFEYKTQKQ